MKKTISDICYVTREDQPLCLDLYLPDSDRFDLLVYFHGGGLEKGDKDDSTTRLMAPWLAERGVAVASVNYRMYPDARYPDFIQDAAQSVCWLSQHIQEYGDCRRIVVSGSSAGGYLSMMLCFDRRWYDACGEFPVPVAGYVHDAGQPTCHFRVLQERGVDKKRLIVDDSCPLYHVGTEREYPSMMFLVSDDDMKNRLEQTQLMLSTLRHFGYDEQKILYQVMHGKHCAHGKSVDENGDSVLGKLMLSFLRQL